MTAATRPDRSWRTAVVAVVGLLIAIAVIGLVGIVINDNIHRTVERAINFDVELEDRGDDLRVAVLEVRHFHRDLLLNAPEVARVDLWEGRYEVLLDEIDAVESAVERQPDAQDLPDISALRALAVTYHDDFTAALAAEPEDPDAFRGIAEDLLVPIDDMQGIAQLVDRAGEVRAQGAFAAIDEASATGTLILVGVIIGLGAMGAFLGIAVLRLVQDQRRLMAVEQAALASMAEASRAKTDFIADASHELRTPLTVLRGNAEVGMAMDASCAHAEILGEIVDEAARMSRLVDDLLFLARSDASSVPLDLRDVDVAEALRALAGRAEVLARERGAVLEPQVRAAGTIRADPVRIDQALLVLVDNAAKYGPPGGIIELAAEIADDRLVMEVRDRGPGIPPEQLSRVFERFYRIEGTARERSARGSGLGLSIAAAIVEGHGGHIVAEPHFGGGTIMRVTLPLRAGRLELAPAAAG